MKIDASWDIPPEIAQLRADEVHLWRGSLAQPPRRVERLWRLLAPDESDRADRFRFEKDRVSYVVARGGLRQILARYLDEAPERLGFRYNPRGKPALARPDHQWLRFNVSHSGQLVLYAMARDREVGVDLERIRAMPKAEEIVDRLFSPREVAQFRALASGERERAFFTCWTRKEAVLKTRGEGLSVPLSAVDVGFCPGDPTATGASNSETVTAAGLSIRDLHPAPGYAAAVAAEGHGWQLKCWSWSE